MTVTSSPSAPSIHNPDSWTKHAPAYQMPSNSFQTTLLDKLLSELAALKPLSSPQTAFLDNGCGTGQLSTHLIANYADQIQPTTRLIATDFSTGMVAEVAARKALEPSPLWQRLETRVEDALSLSGFRDGELTHIGSAMCIFLLPSPETAIAAAHRTLAPGGALAFSSFATMGWWDVLNSEAVRGVKPGFKCDPQIPESMRSEEGVRKAMVDAGFVDVRTQLVAMQMQLPEDQVAFWTKFLKGTNPGIEQVVMGWTEEDKETVALAVAKDLREKGTTVLTSDAIVVAGMKNGE